MNPTWRSFNSLKLYFTGNSYDYWHPRMAVKRKFDKGYFIDLREKAGYLGPFDDCGIFQVIESDGKPHYAVIHMCSFILGQYELFLMEQNRKHLRIFLKHADWLVDNLKPYRGVHAWLNTYPVPLFGLDASWVSALGQGYGISVLVRAYKETDNWKYLDAAYKAFALYTIPVSEGGILIDDGGYFFEEYPTHSYILNGFITAVLGLYDLYCIEQDSRVKEYFDGAIKWLENNLSRYDYGFWSRYDLRGGFVNLSSYFYHDLHVKQLQVLYRLTGRDIFRTYANKWSRQKRSWSGRMRGLAYKIIYRIKVSIK